MALDLSNSSVDKSLSDIGTEHSSHSALSNEERRVSQLTDNLVAYLSTSIQSKLPLTELDINPVNSPQLENIKVETSRLPDDAFQAFINLLLLIRSHRSKLATLRCQAEKNEPIPNDIFKKEEKSLKTAGTTIIDEHHHVISERVRFVEQSQEIFILRICEVFAHSENTQHQQEQLNAVAENGVPPLSAILPPLAPAEWAGNVAVDLAVCEVSRNLGQKSIALKTSGAALQGDMLVATNTQSKLKEYLRDNESARERWVSACQTVFSMEKLEAVSITLQQINFADKKMLQLVLPIQKYLVENNDYHGHGITVIREVDAFCDVVPKIIQDIERIFAAKAIIRSSHKATFGATVHELGLAIFNYLGSMKDNFNQKPIDPPKQKQFLEVTSFHFAGDTQCLIRDLCKILDTQSSSKKSEKAGKDRMARDRCFNSVTWKGRTSMKPGEVRTILEKVEKAVGAIVEVIGGSEDEPVERAHVEFDASDDSLRRLHQVLGEDVDAGLKRLKKLLIKEEPESRMRRIGKHLGFNRSKC